MKLRDSVAKRIQLFSGSTPHIGPLLRKLIIASEEGALVVAEAGGTKKAGRRGGRGRGDEVNSLECFG